MGRQQKPKSQSTAEQRKLLFKTWQATGSVSKACKAAQVERGTFYYWKPRFEVDGYTGLEACESRAPHAPNRVPDSVADQVIELRRKFPSWGKAQISKELARTNHSMPVVSPNTARRILIEAGLWNIDSEIEEQGGECRNNYGPC